MVIAAIALMLAHASVQENNTPPRVSFALVVSRSNAMTNISEGDVRRIYTGAMTRWPDGMHIVPVVPEPNSPEGKLFLKHIVEMTDIDYAQHWISIVFRGQSLAPPRMARSAAEAVQYVTAHPLAIALVAAGHVDDDAVKVLTVDGKSPDDAGYALSW